MLKALECSRNDVLILARVKGCFFLFVFHKVVVIAVTIIIIVIIIILLFIIVIINIINIILFLSLML